MGRVGKKLRNGILEVPLYTLTFDANFPHGFKVAVLLIIAAGIVGQLEQRIVNGIKRALQQITQSGDNCVADTGYLRRHGFVASGPFVVAEVMYAGLLVHSRLLLMAQPYL